MHLFFKVFKPNPRKIILEEENKLFSDDTTFLDIRSFTIKKVRTIIRTMNPKKLRLHKQSSIAEAARNENKIHRPTI